MNSFVKPFCLEVGVTIGVLVSVLQLAPYSSFTFGF